MNVEDAMNLTVVQTGPTSTLREVAYMMLLHGVETVCVIERGRLLGVVGLRDLFTTPIPASYAGQMHEWKSEGQLLGAWREQVIGDIMTEQVLTVPGGMPLLRAAALMISSGKHPLPVTSDGRVVGILSRADVVRALLGLELA
jgi:CBS domain-containing protein